MANRLLADRDASRVGKHWASNFVKPQPELRTRSFRRFDYQRAKCEDPAIIQVWFDLVRNIIAKYGITESDIYNFDETGFMMGVIGNGMVVTAAQRRTNTEEGPAWKSAMGYRNPRGQFYRLVYPAVHHRRG